jgi:ABC-type nitrate/sulfonate/bicarbonate transport system permease component
MVAAQMGLGFRILYGQQTFDTRLVFSGLLMIAVVGFIFDRAILGLSSVLCHWHFRQMDEHSTT